MKTAVITGVSTGIGKACTLFFAQHGYKVIGSVRKYEDAKDLQGSLGSSFHAVVFDVTNEADILRAVEEVRLLLGERGLDVLVNNAGMSVNGPLAYIDPETFAKQLDVNVLGVLRVTQAFLPLLGFPDGHIKGHIINISSGSGKVTRPFMGPYSASKHALESLSDGFRRELLDFGIKVTVVEPGPIRSDIWSKARSSGGQNDYAHTPYKHVYDHLDKMVDTMEGMALDAEKVAKLVFEIAEGRKKRTRYLIAPKKWLFWLAIYVLPDKTLDRMFQKQFAKLTGTSK